MTQERLRELFARHWVKAQPVVLSYLLTIIRPASAAEDVLQEVALKAAGRIGDYDPARPFSPWVMAIARNAAIDHLRRGRRDRLVFDADLIDKFAAEAESVAGEMAEREAALGECLSRLDDRSRRLVAWRYQQDLGVEEIARRLVLKPNAVYAALHRARKSLADCVQRRLWAREGGCP